MCSLSGKATQNIILSNVHTAVPQSPFPLNRSFDKNVPPSQFLLPFMKIREIKSVCRVCVLPAGRPGHNVMIGMVAVCL